MKLGRARSLRRKSLFFGVSYKKQNCSTKKYLFLPVLLLLFIPLIANAEGNPLVDRIHFIKNDDDGADAIVIESNGHFGLVDTMNPGIDESIVPKRSDLNKAKDNGTKVRNYLKSIGANYLDFLVTTHNHSDHNGGVLELLDLVNEKTIAFYKEDITTSDDREEVVWKWYNHQYYLDEINYLTSKNAIQCDVSKDVTNSNGGCYLKNVKNDFITSVKKDYNNDFEYDTNLKHTIYFDFGGFKINLYNLYNVSYHKENYNSMVLLVTHKKGGAKAALMGDQETGRGDIDESKLTGLSHLIMNPTGDCEQCTTLGLENQDADIIGEVDLLKAGHHGYDSSNSYYMLNKLKPKYLIFTKEYQGSGSNIYPQDSAVAATFYTKNEFDTVAYYTKESSGAIVAEFNDENRNIAIKNNNADGTESSTTMKRMGSYAPNGWYSMNDITNKSQRWIYIQNNNMVTGWKKVDDVWYYFDDSGIMQTGLIFDGNNYYYLTKQEESSSSDHKHGSMITGWKKVDGIWYYFRKADNEFSTGPIGSGLIGKYKINDYWYYFDEEAKMQKGFVEIGEETYYFRKSENEISTGPEGSAVISKCFANDNVRYCFDADGKMTSATQEGDSSTDKIHFIKNEDHAGDATVIESNGHFGLIDTLKPASGLHSNEYDNGEKVAKYLDLIGCTHLDFLIITHTHSDHLGGLTETDDQQHKLSDFIDSNTLVFYKPDILAKIDGETWDFEEHLNFGHQQFYQNALSLYRNKNAKTCNLTTEDINNASSADPNGGCYLRGLKNSTITSVGKEINPFMGYATNLDDNYYFNFGNYSLKIYNTHIVANQMENLNSTPVLITHKITGKKIVVLGDIQAHASEYEGYQDGQYIKSYINKHLTNVLGYADSKLWADSNGKLTGAAMSDPLYAKVLKYSIREPFGSCEECKTLGEENQIADIIGQVDVVKAAHHGYNTSSSFYSIFKYQPRYMIYSKNKEKMYTYLEKNSSDKSDWKHASAIALLSYKNLGTKHYSTYQVGTNKGIVLTFDDAANNIKFKALNKSGVVIDYSYSNIAANIIKSGSYKDTEKWYWNHNTNSTDAARIYMDANGELTTGWLEYSGNWYYFSKAEETKGLMLKGLRNLSYNSVKDTYYLTPNETSSYPEGAMQHGGLTEAEGDYYYFRTTKDDVSEGPKGAAITGWYTSGSKKYYFRKEKDEYGTGRKGSALKDTCVVMGNYKYCFDSDAVQTSKTAVTSATIPTSSMCRDLSYTGAEQTLTKNPATGYTWSNNKGTNAGYYTVQAVLKNSYKWSDDTLDNKTIKCRILKGDRAAPVVVSYKGNYDGNSHSITVTGDGTIEYSLDNRTWSTTKPTRKDAGTTTVYVRIKEDNNYNVSQVVEGTITITAGKGYNIKNYTVDETNNYISGITVNTSIESFKNNIELETGYSVEVDYKTINNKKVLYTGGKTKIMKSGVVYKEFTNSVLGDTSGDGIVSYLDYVKVYNHIQKTKDPSSTKQLLKGVYLLAADMSKDNKITYLDYVKIYNKIKELKSGAN